MSSFKKLGFLVIALIVSGKVMAMQKDGQITLNPAFESDLQVSLLPTPSGSPHGSETGELPRPATARRLQEDDSCFGTCLQSVRDCFGFTKRTYDQKSEQLADYLREHPKVRVPVDLGINGAICASMSNYMAGTVLADFAQYNLGVSMEENFALSGVPLPIRLAAYAGAATAAVYAEDAMNKGAMMGEVDDVPAQQDDYYYYSGNGTTIIDESGATARQPVFLGLPKAFVLAGFEAIRKTISQTAKPKKED